jgi:gliding motility-associated-like protein
LRKKITFLLLAIFFSTVGYSQFTPLVEGFESTSGPEAAPSTDWPLNTGNWLVFDNGVGTALRWDISSSTAPPTQVHQGLNSAYMGRQTSFPENQTIEDYLASPEVFIPTNGQLKFWTRGFLAGNQGTVYQIKIAPANVPDPTNPMFYTLVQQWTDADLVTTISQFQEKTVDLTDYAGLTVRIAFVMQQAPIASPFGDRWFIDDVSVVERCFDPTLQAVTNITSSSANLNWTSPAGSSSWEIEVVPATANPTGVGTIYNGAQPYQVTATTAGDPLTPLTAYKYYVRVVCTNTASQWMEGTFTTLRKGLTCSDPIVISDLSYLTTDNTANYADTYDTAQPTACAGTATNYMAGNDVFYSYTATETGNINIKLTPTAAGSGIFVYNTCPGAGVACVGGVANTNANPRNMNIQVTAGVTYIIVISSSNLNQTVGYTLLIQQSFCDIPAAPTVSGITQTSANFSWAAGTSSSWEVLVQEQGQPFPTVAGTLTSVNTNSPSPTLLTSNTAYEVYVRTACGDGTFSGWIGPVSFRTLCDAFSPSFQEGFNTTSTTQPCWTVINGNNDANAWDMDYATTPFEGNQSASINTSTGSTNNDWLISPQIILDGNQRLKFRYRTGTATQNASFRVMLSTTGGIAPADFTEVLVPTTAYTNVNYLERVVNLSGYTGTVSIAWHVPQGSPGGNRLFIDNVIVEDIPACPEPSTIVSSAVTHNTVNLEWTNGGGETQWQVIALPCNAPAPTAASTGWEEASSNPYVLGNGTIQLNPLTCYNVYVRAVCDSGVSPWTSDPGVFTTLVAPPVCGGTYVDFGGPAGNYLANTDETFTVCAPAGELVTIAFTSFNVEPLNDALYIFDGNSTTSPQFASANGPGNVPGGLAGGFWGTTLPGPYTASAPGGCLTFKFVSNATVQNAGWTANVLCAPAPTCTKPSTFTYTDLTATSVSVGWIQHPNPDNSVSNTWHVIALPCGSPMPTAATTGWEVAMTNPHTFENLDPNTCYDFYVRAVCAGTDTSVWAGIKNITTFCVPIAIPFQEGFNSDSLTEACWTVLNANNDDDAWDMNYGTNPYEGNQVASILTQGNGTGPNANNDWLISPQLSGLNGNQRLRYRYRVESSGTPNAFRVMLSPTSSTTPADFTTTLVPLATYNNTTYVEAIVPLTDITGTVNIAFHVQGGSPAGNRLYIDKFIVENIPTCFEPTALQVISTTSSSAYLSWTDNNTPPATQWEIIVLPQGSSEPLITLPINPLNVVSANPVQFTGLESSTFYTYYVRAICSDTDTSVWSLGANFVTKPGNDECENAEFVPVNSGQECLQFVSGIVTGATPSGLPNLAAPCVGTADDDVWYQFIATNSYLTASLLNIVGATMNFAVYSGTCGTLTQYACSGTSANNSLSFTLNNLIVGDVYYIRVYSNSAQPQTASFDICITTPSTCSNARTVCDYTYSNTTGVTSLGTIGCLNTSPNPTFFTIQIDETGPVNYFMSQTSSVTGNGIDVDYAAWGPFTSQAAACSAINLANGGFLAPGIGVPVTQQTGCSYSAASTETLNIANAQAGEYYIILITNFSNQPGTITLTQTNANQPGAGATQCCPDAYFTYNNNNTFCKVAGEPNPVATALEGSVLGSFTASPDGLVFIDTATGVIDLMASAPGYYQITNTTIPDETCDASRTAFTFIRITEIQTATLQYAVATACNNDTTVLQATTAGAINGTFSVQPQGGLYINPDNGDISPNLSSPGTYTVSYNPPDTGSCPPGAAATATVEIKAAPNAVTPGDIVACDSYELPALSIGNYFTGPDATGELLTLPHTVTSSQTIYVYTSANGCINQNSFDITINTVPDPTVAVTHPVSCAAPTGTIEVTSPTGAGTVLPTNLFISEVTDHASGSLTYVELYNATGADIDLSNYKLKVFTFGNNPVPGSAPNSACDLTLAGTIANNDTFVIKLSGSANQGGVVPDASFTSCAGVNSNDYIKLTSSTDVDIDLWGKTDGSHYTPAGQPGYTYRRLNSGTLPSAIWIETDWTALDPEDYTNIGEYEGLPLSGYEYSIDNGPQQPGTIFTGVEPGNHTIIVHDLATGCSSAPFEVVVNQPPGEVTTTFTAVSPICSGDALSALPTTSLEGITGTWSPALNNTATTTYTFTPDNGQCATPATLEIVVNERTTPTFTAIPTICVGGNATLPATSLEGIPGTWSPAFNNAATTTYTFTPAAGQCATTATLTITVGEPVVPTFDPIDTVVCSGDAIAALPTTSINGIAGTWSPALNNTATTTYTFTPTVGQCATVVSITINVTPLPEFTITQGCMDSDYTLAAVDSNLSNPSYAWFDASNNAIGSEQTVVVTASGTYKLVITQDGCSTEELVDVASALCTFDIQKGISANNDGYNDNFELSTLGVKELKIFNRYGMKVYSKGNYTNEWYGQSDKGDELPDGTYYYVIDRNTGATVTGWIYINREQ